ncbi:MAG: Mbeg1-like protein [Candidatus Ornithospirochaeta sp.]
MRSRLNILDVMTWLGEVGKESLPYYDVDMLAITILEYRKTEGIRKEDYGKTIRELENQACPIPIEEAKLFDVNQFKLWKKMASSRRYSTLRLMDAVGETTGEGKDAEQYAAALFQDGDDSYLVYRGTDESLTGWKEDFNMAFEDEIPAEKRALESLEKIAPKTKRLHILGHSKGGTLALYSALKASGEAFEKISSIYVFDAPGLPDSLIEGERWEKVKSITHSYIPTSSIIGMLFNTIPGATVVKSSSLGLLQHDAFTWNLSGGKFVVAPEISQHSRKVDKTVRNFLSMTPKSEREVLVETMFKILKVLDEENVWLMPEVAAKRFPEIKNAISSLTSEEKDTLKSILLTLEKARRNVRKEI